MSKLTITDLHRDETLSHSDMGAIAGGRLPGWVGDIAEAIKDAGEKSLKAGGGFDTAGVMAGLGAGLVLAAGAVIL